MTATKLTNKALREAAGNNRLLKHVARWIISQSKDGYNGNLGGPLKDLFYGGCASGVVGNLVYYRDTVAFYERFREEIWALGIEQAEDFGHRNVFELFAGLNVGCLGDYDQVANGLAWFGFEEAARKLADAVGYDE